MSSSTIIFGKQLYRSKVILCGISVLFMMLLGSTLVMLPLVSKQNKTIVLNQVEEEAGSGSNGLTEENKHGKSIHSHLFDLDSFMQLQWVKKANYNIPASVDILSSLHARRVVQPPEC